jgi:four helix bundle protein
LISVFFFVLTLTLALIAFAMFDFQKLEVYKKAKVFHVECKNILLANKFDRYVNDQLGRASFSVPLNIAEGSGKFSKADRRNYFTTARASVFECIAILDILCDGNQITTSELEQLMNKADELSRILYTMIKNLS